MTFKNKCIGWIEHYQKEISPRKPKNCRCPYTPSCSEYTKQAIIKYGAFRGILKGAWRIFRCNPFTKGGHDPVK